MNLCFDTQLPISNAPGISQPVLLDVKSAYFPYKKVRTPWAAKNGHSQDTPHGCACSVVSSSVVWNVLGQHWVMGPARTEMGSFPASHLQIQEHYSDRLLHLITSAVSKWQQQLLAIALAQPDLFAGCMNHSLWRLSSHFSTVYLLTHCCRDPLAVSLRKNEMGPSWGSCSKRDRAFGCHVVQYDLNFIRLDRTEAGIFTYCQLKVA